MPMLFDSDRLAQCDKIFAEEVDGAIAGIVCLASNGCDGSHGPTLATLYTAPEHRGKGIGLRLCEYGIRHFAEAGKTPIFCDVTTRGMHKTIDRLSGELQAHLKTDLSYQAYGDEFDGRPW
ncbi:MAG: GNAT family N-acetyltransferase [Planctomycetaceae bacterium]